MAVANSTIIQKMMKEIQQAQLQQHNNPMLIKHISNIHMLCELLLEEHEQGNGTEDMQQELKMMMGDSEREIPLKTTTRDHDQANGDSIFDF